ncbi:MAG TPA: hypothetical protein VME66_09935 [Candidatus Acidoferrales bacterium]|nr:hypothetical protein [Candidatus Acidoferrales bacterium]
MNTGRALTGWDAWMEPIKGAVALLGLMTGLAGMFFTNDSEVAVISMCITSACALVFFQSVTPAGD